MARIIMDDREVEREIERLNHSEAVRLAREEQQIKYRRRQYLQQLRDLEKRGLELMANGIELEICFSDSELF